MGITPGAYKLPDKHHGFNFLYAGDIRFGPSFYKVMLDGELPGDKIFGFEFKWHPESKYLGLQEWLTTHYQKAPIAALAIGDLRTRKITKISKAEKVIIKSLKFENDLIVFVKDYFASGKTVENEINYEQNHHTAKKQHRPGCQP